eukprot:m.142528 g.142528  ORF g.142528 m.142528 type:complete len:474 (+) comp11587_c1_seq7:1273-2694(+)
MDEYPGMVVSATYGMSATRQESHEIFGFGDELPVTLDDARVDVIDRYPEKGTKGAGRVPVAKSAARRWFGLCLQRHWVFSGCYYGLAGLILLCTGSKGLLGLTNAVASPFGLEKALTHDDTGLDRILGLILIVVGHFHFQLGPRASRDARRFWIVSMHWRYAAGVVIIPTLVATHTVPSSFLFFGVFDAVLGLICMLGLRHYEAQSDSDLYNHPYHEDVLDQLFLRRLWDHLRALDIGAYDPKTFKTNHPYNWAVFLALIGATTCVLVVAAGNTESWAPIDFASLSFIISTLAFQLATMTSFDAYRAVVGILHNGSETVTTMMALSAAIRVVSGFREGLDNAQDKAVVVASVTSTVLSQLIQLMTVVHETEEPYPWTRYAYLVSITLHYPTFVCSVAAAILTTVAWSEDIVLGRDVLKMWLLALALFVHLSHELVFTFLQRPLKERFGIPLDSRASSVIYGLQSFVLAWFITV